MRPLRPSIPVIAVTGTNGKTTTTRLIAHLVKAGGRTPGWSSTDGIFIDGEEVETGDWSGPGGAARVLEDPRVQVAVTETARGGILLRGVGTAVNDVSVVTNISADHLGLLGVHTVEQLAEVKSVVARITKPNGWTVLNADDPLVRAMRSVSRARPWFYSPDPDNPYLDEALEAGGRAITVVDGKIVVLGRGHRPDHRHRRRRRAADPGRRVQGERVQRAGRDRRGDRDRGAAGRGPHGSARASPPGAEHNAGRLNVYLLGSIAVLLDLAHNEASLESLLEVAGALRAARRRAGGGARAPPATAPTRRSTRWARWPRRRPTGWSSPAGSSTCAGANRARWRRSGGPAPPRPGWCQVDESPDELSGLTHLLDEASPPLPDGSAVAVCALEQREEMVAEIERRGGAEMTPDEVAARVASAR